MKEQADPGVAFGSRPLLIWLDNGLALVDTLVESTVAAIRHSPLEAVVVAMLALRSRPVDAKERLARGVWKWSPGMPLNEALLEYIRDQRSSGRKIVLLSHAHQKAAEFIAGQIGLFDAVVASEPGRNVSRESIGGILEHLYPKGFGLAGKQVGAPCELELRTEKPKVNRIAELVTAMRVHQWSKNLLLFVPLLTAFAFGDPISLFSAALAFIAFSLLASGTYILNDILDLPNDRAHSGKKGRPFASGAVQVRDGLLLSLGLTLVAFGTAMSVGRFFVAMLLGYLVITLTYSLYFKRLVLMDVMVLALLYTWRILAGSVAIHEATSMWLMAFSTFIFLNLALAKRCTELESLRANGKTRSPGRDYRVSDLDVLMPLGAGAALSSVVVLGLYISSTETRIRYATPEMLWLAALGLIYWLAKVWLKVSRGEMHDDPILYAVKNVSSRFTLLGIVIVVVAAFDIDVRALIG